MQWEELNMKDIQGITKKKLTFFKINCSMRKRGWRRERLAESTNRTVTTAPTLEAYQQISHVQARKFTKPQL